MITKSSHALVETEDASCPLGCPRSDKYVLSARDRLHDLPGEFSIVRCKSCGLMRTNPRPTAEAIGFYYPDEYGPYTSPLTLDEKAGRVLLKQSFPKRWLRSAFLRNSDGRELPDKPAGRLLEIGCATGAFLDRAHERGWDVEGIEFSAKAAEAARLRGHKVQITSMENARDPIAPYDVIVGWMVLEHLHQPIEVLKKLRRWSHSDSYLLLSVPDLGALEFHVFGSRLYSLSMPHHLYHFTVRSLNKLLKHSGWRIERFIWHKNPNNLLHSLQYVAGDYGLARIANYLECVAVGTRAKRFRTLLGILLGMLHQSGRVTVWARPDL